MFLRLLALARAEPVNKNETVAREFTRLLLQLAEDLLVGALREHLRRTGLDHLWFVEAWRVAAQRVGRDPSRASLRASLRARSGRRACAGRAGSTDRARCFMHVLPITPAAVGAVQAPGRLRRPVPP